MIRPARACIAITSLTLVACVTPTGDSELVRARGGPVRHLGFSVGARALGDDYSPVEDQAAIGVEYTWEAPDAIVGWEIGIAGSKDDGGAPGLGLDVKVLEGYGGLHRSFGSREAPLRPYLGAGLSIVSVEVDIDGPSFHRDDASLGGYVHGGLRFTVSPNAFVALDARTLFGTDLDLGVAGDVDYDQLSVVFGFSH